MRVKHIRPWLAWLALSLLIASFVLAKPLTSHARRIRIDVAAADGQANPVAVGTIHLRPGEEVSEATVRCEFYVDAVRGHENVFQTADGTSGVRLELWHPSAAGVGVGDTASSEVAGFGLSPGLKLGKWNRLEVRIPDSGYTVVTLNEVTAAGKRLRPRWDRLLVGAGQAPFHGRVRDFRAELVARAPRPYGQLLLNAARLILLLLALYCGSRVTLPVAGLSKEGKIKGICALVLLGFVAAVFFHYVAGNYCRLEYPWSTFLFLPREAFGDFFPPLRDAALRDPYSPGMCGGYAPFCYLMLYPLALLQPLPALLVFLGATVAFVLAFQWRTLRVADSWLRAHGVVVLTLLTYPMLMVLDRGNLDGLLFPLMALFVFAYRKGYVRTGAVLLAMASAMKLYPAIFLILFLADRKYKEMALTVVLFLLLTAASLCWLSGGLMHNLTLFFANLTRVFGPVESDDMFLQFNSTAYGFLRVFFDMTDPERCHRLYLAYKYGCLGVLAALCGYFVWFERSYWRRVSLLTLAMLLLPAVNFDYRLIFLLIPLGLFLEERGSRLDILYVFFFALLLVPKTYFIIRGFISCSVLINPALMAGLIGLHLYDRWASRSARDVECLGPRTDGLGGDVLRGPYAADGQRSVTLPPLAG